MVNTPYDYFAGDWTFNDVDSAMLFQIELNIMTLTVLAPNLPVFFEKTSTGGIFFMPNETGPGSRRGTDPTPAKAAELDRVRWSSLHTGKVYDGKESDATNSTIIGTANGGKEKRASFDSDVILMSRSIDIDTAPDGGNPTQDVSSK